jgi:hypothetical protein
MSRFKRTSHVIWHCQYHIVWVPNYRFRVLQGPVGKEVYKFYPGTFAIISCPLVRLKPALHRFRGVGRCSVETYFRIGRMLMNKVYQSLKQQQLR